MSVHLTPSKPTPPSHSGALADLLEAIQKPIGKTATMTHRLAFDNKTQMLNNQSAVLLIKRGISSKALAPLSDFLGIGRGQVAGYLDMDRTTVARHVAKGQNLPMHSAENVLRLIEIANMASGIFATDDEAFAWLRKPHPMLEGDSPFQAAKTSFGTQHVKDILFAIKYGGVV